jgi:hypothetical protein
MNSLIFGDLTGEVRLDNLPFSKIEVVPSVLERHLGHFSGFASIDSDKEMSQLLDVLLDEAIADFEWKPEAQPGGSDSSMKWRYSSAYQKAVRRNDPSIMRAGLMLNACDPAYIWRRGATIAIEDISMGDPWVCALVVDACRFVRSRSIHGADKLSVFLGKLMGAAVKDRLACDGFCLPIYHPEMVPTRNAVEAMPAQQRADIYRSDANPFAWRIAAGISLAGPRYGYEVFQGAGGSPDLFFEALEGMVPYPIWWTSRSYAKIARDGMFVSYPLVWRQLAAGPQPEIARVELPERQMVDGVLSATFDGHTQEGRRAISYFCKSCGELASFLEANPSINTKAATMAVFTVDSSLLDRFVKTPWAVSLYKANLQGEIAGLGISQNQAANLMSIIERNRDELHHARRRVTGESSSAQA